MSRFLALRIVVGIAYLLIPASLLASSEPDRVQFGHDIRISSNDKVGDVTFIGCSVHVSGQVSGDVTTIAVATATGIRLIQSRVNGNESGTGSMSVSFASSNTQGDFLIVTGSAARPASTLSVSDTLGNSYTPAMGPATDGAQDVTIYVWYVPMCKGGANTVTIVPAATAALATAVAATAAAAMAVVAPAAVVTTAAVTTAAAVNLPHARRIT